MHLGSPPDPLGPQGTRISPRRSTITIHRTACDRKNFNQNFSLFLKSKHCFYIENTRMFPFAFQKYQNVLQGKVPSLICMKSPATIHVNLRKKCLIQSAIKGIKRFYTQYFHNSAALVQPKKSVTTIWCKMRFHIHTIIHFPNYHFVIIKKVEVHTYFVQNISFYPYDQLIHFKILRIT